MKTGQLITSFLQGKASPTMTSTIFNPYVDPATVESKTGYYNESLGATQDTSSRTKTVGSLIIRGANDLLPYKLRPIKSRRRHTPKVYPLRVEIYTFRLVWQSHHWPAIKKKIKNLIEKIKK